MKKEQYKKLIQKLKDEKDLFLVYKYAMYDEMIKAKAFLFVAIRQKIAPSNEKAIKPLYDDEIEAFINAYSDNFFNGFIIQPRWDKAWIKIDDDLFMDIQQLSKAFKKYLEAY